MSGVASFWSARAQRFTENHWPARTLAVGLVTAAALVVTLAEPAGPARAAEPQDTSQTETASAESAEPLVRPDGVSARVTALATGERVEVEGLRDEFTTTFVNPDGTWTTEAHSGQHRYRDDKGEWAQVDLTLQAGTDGVVRPNGHPGGLTLSGGGPAVAGGTELLRIAPGSATAGGTVNPGAPGSDLPDGAFALTWPGRLPAPTLEGEKATYSEVLPGIDLVVEARRSGFEQYLVLKNRAAVVSQVVGGALAFNVGVRGNGISTGAAAAGGLELVDAAGAGAGDVLWRVPPALAWDAAVDRRSGDPANTSAVALGLVPPGQGAGQGAGQGRGLALGSVRITPNLGWLLGASRQFPVTVDPTYAQGSFVPTLDTFVQSNIANTDQSTSTELRVGTYDGSTVARSFLNFTVSAASGLDVVSANLSVNNTYSYSCTAATVTAYQMQTQASTSTRWGAQPAIYATAQGSVSAAKGYSSACAAGRIAIPVTGLVQAWANAGSTASGISLRASETAVSGWKKFASSETSTDPVLTYTYNRKPGAASAPYPSPALKYSTTYYTSAAKPTLSAIATDPDGSRVQLKMEVHTSTTGSNLLQSCMTGLVASGATASCPVPNALADDSEYYVRAAVKDELGLWNGAWSPWLTVRTGIADPGVAVTCGREHRSWTDDLPASPVSCTASTSGGTIAGMSKMTVLVDGVSITTPALGYPVKSVTFTVPNTEGGHVVKVSTKSASGKITTLAPYQFGYGGASLTSPEFGDATNGKFKISAMGPARGAATAVTAIVKWRRAGGNDETTGWNIGTVSPAPTVVNGTGGTGTLGVSTDFVWDANTAVTDTTTTPATELPTRTPVRLDVQVCFVYDGASQNCTWSQPALTGPATITRMPHAFGNGFPTAEAGPGQVALFTGEWNTSVTDVTVPAYTGTLSLSRSHSTYDGPENLANWPSLPGSGVLGPGWTLGLDGSDLGSAELQVVDATHLDGTISLVAADGTALVYMRPDGKRRTLATLLPSGTTQQDWVPVDEDTAASGAVLSIKDTASVSSGVTSTTPGGGLDLLLRDEGGTVTTYVLQNTPTATTPGLYTPGLVDEPGQLGTTVYSRDGAGRITRILAPTPPGVTCAATGALAAGCRALNLTYATADTTDIGNGRDVTSQLKEVRYEAWNPEKSGGAGMDTLLVGSYAYDSSKRLTRVTDNRAQETTRYTYDGTTPRVKTITPPGLAPFTLNYAANIAGSGSNLPVQLASVDRGNPSGDAGDPDVRVTSFVYGIDPGTQGGPNLPDLDATDVAVWQQMKVPAYGAAVFSGATNPGTHDGSPASSTTIPAATWAKADLQYTTADGWTVNTASHGAGAWQVTAQDYDEHGNVIRSLDAGAIAQHAADHAAGAPDTALSADPYATLTQYNKEEKLDTALTLADGTVLPVGHVFAAAGTKVLHEWGPTRHAMVDTDGSAAGSAPAQLDQVRPHTRTLLDEGAPGVGPEGKIDPATHQRYNLATTTIVGAAAQDAADNSPGVAIAADVQVISVTRNGYGALEASPPGGVAGSTSGWVHGTPTRVREIMNPSQVAPYGANDSADIVRDTFLDTEGRVVQTRQPKESNAAGSPSTPGPGTRVTRYYTAAAQTSPSGDPACGSKPQWAGLVCTAGPAGTTAAGTGGAVTTTRTNDFTWFLTPKTVVETSSDSAASVSRITTTSFDAKDRPTGSTTTLSGITPTVSEPLPATTTTYDTVTGLPATVTDSTGTVTTTYDAWGRAKTYTSTGSNGQGATTGTTTTFDADGRVATVTDQLGTTTYTYDGTDALGRTENRGVPTRVDTTTLDAAGNPGPTVTLKGAYDTDGALVVQQMPGGLTMTDTFDEAGEPLGRTYTGPDGTDADTDPDAWLGWSQVNDVTGRVIAEHTPNASVFDDNGAGATTNAAQYHRAYTYDGTGRLVTVKDRTAPANTAGIELGEPGDPVDSGSLGAVAGCTTRQYTFDKNGARTDLATYAGAIGAACPTASGAGVTTTTRTWTLDGADRTTGTSRTAGSTTTTGTYVFDALGRVTTLPGIDTPGGINAGTTTGNATINYRTDDSVWKMTVPSATGGTTGTLTQVHSYDTIGRRVQAVSTDTSKPTGQQAAGTLTRYYTDTSDNPGWTVQTEPDPASPTTTRTTQTRYLAGLGGGLTMTATKTTVATGINTNIELMLANLHGDIAATTQLHPSGTALPSATGIDTWNDTDEYGNVRPGGTTATPAAYGWHGAAERSAATSAGLTLMGARLYNPITGLFTSTDPVYGGNVNTFTSPNDPVNTWDLNGENLFGGPLCYCGGGKRGVSTGRGSWGAPQGYGGIRRSAQRTTVPKPRLNTRANCKRRNANCYKGETIGYTIYRDGKIWKYGISSVGESRPRGQISSCTAGGKYSCRYHVNARFHNRWRARNWEYQKYASYVKKHKRCPQGSPLCR